MRSKPEPVTSSRTNSAGKTCEAAALAFSSGDGNLKEMMADNYMAVLLVAASAIENSCRVIRLPVKSSGIGVVEINWTAGVWPDRCRQIVEDAFVIS